MSGQVAPRVLRIKVHATRTRFKTELLFRGEDTQEWWTNSSDSAGGPANVATRDFHFFRVKIL
jgi:hypothetical protein